jgi:hypothetical protein
MHRKNVRGLMWMILPPRFDKRTGGVRDGATNKPLHPHLRKRKADGS